VPAPEIDEEREERLARVIVVDCYNEYEAWQGRWCHLDGKPTGPFQAECIRVRRGLPLEVGEHVTVTGMFDDDEAVDSPGEMQVGRKRQGRKLGVTLAELAGFSGAAETAETIADWHYRVPQGRQF